MDAGLNTMRRESQVRQAWGEWLERFPWDHYVTLTFKDKSGPDLARRSFDRWIRRLEQEAKLPLLWFVGHENGRLLGRLHLHALVGNTREVSPAVMEKLWTPGWSRIMPYQPTLGAAYYVTKYVTKEMLDYDVSPNFKRALTARDRQFRLGIAAPTTRTRSRPFR